MTAPDPSVPTSTIVSIDGPADVVAPVAVEGDVCLPLGEPWDPSEGQTSRSLQPCTIVVVPDPRLPALSTAEVPVSTVRLPDTGAVSTGLVLTACLVFVVGVVAVLGSRVRPRLSGTRNVEELDVEDDQELSRAAVVALGVLVWVVAPVCGAWIAAWCFKRWVF